MIEVKNIKKKFGDIEVLKGIDGIFEKGKTNLIIGASGTGKSVLLKNIVGLIDPDQGDILYDGRDFMRAERKETKKIRQEIGMLFQGSALFDSMTVEQNIMFPLDMTQPKMSQADKLERVNFCLQRVDLPNVNDKMPSEISGGMKKRVGIARAIVLNPKYLFCDEPNSGLDPLTAILIDQLIGQITKEYNMTTVVVTHDMNSVMEIGEKIMFLYKGEKLWEGNNSEIMDTGVEKLNEFIFSNELMRRFRPQK